ncbi:MAG: type I methionyl aminopeptidase [Actinomycetota bacterium]
MERIRSNSPCWCGSGKKYKRCHGDRRLLQRSRVRAGTVGPSRVVPEHIARPDYVVTGAVGTPRGHQLQDAASLPRLRRACQIAAEVLQAAGNVIEPGVTTDEIDAIAHEAYVARDAYPSDLHYRGFGKSVCTSVNGVICHGIPDDRRLEDGDIVNVDVTAYAEGMHGDTSATFIVGDIDEPTRALVETTREATLRGIEAVLPGEPLRRIGEAIEPFARSRGFAVVREYGGHGIGETFHARPHIHHHAERHDTDLFEIGMSFTIEPMLLSGGASFAQSSDGWTERVDDDMPSAQFEHTVVVTPTGAEILTVTSDGLSATTPPDLVSSRLIGAQRGVPVPARRGTMDVSG